MTRRKYKPYPEYKDSGVEWLGRVPRHWESIRLKFFLRDSFEGLKIGPFGSQLRKEMLVDNGPYKVYGQENVIKNDFILGSRFIDEKKYDELSVYEISSGDLLITMMGTSGKCRVAPRSLSKGIMDSHLLRMRLKSNVSPELVRILLEESANMSAQIEASGKGSIMHGLNSAIIKDLIFGVPPFSEQLSILKFLDRETSRIDRLIEKKERFIELLKEKRQALISHAVTKGLPPEAAAKAGLDPNPPMKDSGIEWIGEVPAHWEVKKIKHLFSFTSGGTPPTDHREYWNGNLPWVSSKDMKANILLDTKDHITEEAVQRTSTSAVTKDTLLIVVRSGILRHSIPVAIAGVRMAINQDIKGLSPLVNRCSTHFLAWYIYGQQAQLLLAWRKEGATVESIDMESMQNFNISVPPTSEQDNICSYLSIENKRFEDLIQKTHLSISLLRERRTALITAAVTGQIDVRESISHRAGGKSQQEAPA
jgi:type I restriction enzyme S subunit